MLLQAYDEQHNKRLSGGDCFLVHLLGPAGKAVAADVADLGDGTYTVTYCCTVAGGYDVHITSG